jgi:hypothetical protein
MFLLVTPVELVPPDDEVQPDPSLGSVLAPTYPTINFDHSQTLVNLDFVKRCESVTLLSSQGPFMVTRLHGIDLHVQERIDQISDALGQEFANASEAFGPEVAKGEQRVQAMRSRDDVPNAWSRR